jgi:hypothetical protein
MDINIMLSLLDRKLKEKKDVDMLLACMLALGGDSLLKKKRSR